MPIYGVGFNAHRQLTDTEVDDLVEFVELVDSSDDSESKILFAGWSSTYSGGATFAYHKLNAGKQGSNNGIKTIGKHAKPIAPPGPSVGDIVAGFGDHNGLRGAIDADGRLYVVSDSGELLKQGDAEESPRLAHVAVAGNGAVAIVFRSMRASVTHITQYESLDAFFAWYEDPASPTLYPPQHFIVGGGAKQLVAGAVGFVILMQGGEVYTWADQRFGPSLGRELNAEMPAGKPGPVGALGGLKVTKAATGGFMSTAVTEAGDAYIWGMEEPGAASAGGGSIGIGEVAKIELPHEGDDELDVVDIAVGDGHALVLDSQGKVWSMGKNTNGQLGLGKVSTQPVPSWQRVSGLESALKHKVQSIVCGPLASFVIAP